MEAVFKQHLFTPQRIMTLGSNESVKQTVMAGMGVSLLSLHTLELELRTGEIGLLDINGTPVMRSWHLVNMNAKKPVAGGGGVRQFLLEHTHTYLEKTFAPYRKVRRRGNRPRRWARPPRSSRKSAWPRPTLRLPRTPGGPQRFELGILEKARAHEETRTGSVLQ
jgi:hypothetical protein